MSRFLLALSLSATAVVALTACSGLDSDTDSLDRPAIFATAPPEGCSSTGATTIVLDPLSAVLVENIPISDPLGQHQVRFSGTVSGLGANAAYALVVDSDFACPVLSSAALALTGDGSFTTSVRISTSTGNIFPDFRIIVVTGEAGATPACPTGTDCLRLEVAGGAVALTGISNAIGVRT